jgi:hypothetical protein
VNVRELVERYPLIGWGLGALVVVAFALACYGRLRPQKMQPPMVWYYDVGNGAVFAARSAEPPIHAPSGQDGVIAHVFSCGNCAVGSEHVIAYLETDSPDYHQAAVKVVNAGQLINPQRGLEAFQLSSQVGGRLVAKPESPLSWTSRNSEDGQTIIQASVTCPEGQTAHLCMPQ